MRKKLKSNKAETLLESLISLLIATLSITFLSTSIMTAAKTNQLVKNADERFTTDLACAEMKSAKLIEEHWLTISFTEGEDDVSERSVKVVVYGQGAFISYERVKTNE